MPKTITQINQMRADRMKLINEARAINEKAEKENRHVLNADEQKKYDELTTESRSRLAAIKREEELAEMEEDAAPSRRSAQLPALDDTEQRSNEDEDDEDDSPEILTEVPAHLRALFGTALMPQTKRSAFHFADAHRRASFRNLSKAKHASKEYRQAYDRFLRSAGRITTGLISAEADSREARTMQADSDTGGGYMLAPAQMVAELIKTLDNAVIIRQNAKKFTSGYNGIGAVSLDTDLSNLNWTTELEVGSEDEIAIGKRELKPHPLAKLIKISKTLARESPNMVSLINERLAYVLGITQETAYMTGSGNGQPLGVFTASTDGIPTSRDISTGNTTTAIVADNLKTVKYTLKAEHRRKARWLFHRDAVLQVDKLKDGAGQYLWQPGLIAGQPDRLLNLPLDESEYAPNTFTTGQYVGLLANWDYYWIVDHLNLAIQVLVELYAGTNKNGYHARYEGDGMPVLPEAFVRVKLG